MKNEEFVQRMSEIVSVLINGEVLLTRECKDNLINALTDAKNELYPDESDD